MWWWWFAVLTLAGAACALVAALGECLMPPRDTPVRWLRERVQDLSIEISR